MRLKMTQDAFSASKRRGSKIMLFAKFIGDFGSEPGARISISVKTLQEERRGRPAAIHDFATKILRRSKIQLFHFRTVVGVLAR
jgi:hypothetical protein